MDAEDDRAATALHEAGHAVAAVVLRMGLQSVDIVPGLGSGNTLLTAPYGTHALREAVYVRPDDAGARRRLWRALVQAEAGYVAEEVAGWPSLVDWDSDPEGTLGYAAVLVYPEYAPRKRLDAIRGAACARAEVLVRRHWRRIDALGMALLERDRLTGQEAIRIIRSAT